jgi:Cu-processing system ATP-binding protein
MIEITSLNKKFGKMEVLKDLDLSIMKGGIFAVLGPNGSGKTTLIKSVLGIVVPNSGEIKIDGKSILGQFDYRNNVNYLPQIANFPTNLSVKELLTMIKDIRGKNADDERLIKLFGIQEYLDKKLGHLSGGTKQKVNIVLAFMFDSELIILDEPTSGLDPLSMIHLKELIAEEKAKGKTILMTSHIISFVEAVADQIVFLLDGKIYFKGTLADLLTQTKQADLEHSIAHILEGTYA